TEAIIAGAIEALDGNVKRPWGETVIDFTPPFDRKTYAELFLEHVGCDMSDQKAVECAALDNHLEIKYEGAALEPNRPAELSRDEAQRGYPGTQKALDVLVSELFEHKVEAALEGPIFVVDSPPSLSPLTKQKKSTPAVAERFELFVHGMEVANAYTELN